MYQQLVDDLALQIRDYPRNGGPRPDGMQLLQRGRSRVIPVTWPRNSTVPNDVAELCWGFSFTIKKLWPPASLRQSLYRNYCDWNLHGGKILFLEASSSPASSKLATTASTTYSAQSGVLSGPYKPDVRSYGNLQRMTHIHPMSGFQHGLVV